MPVEPTKADDLLFWPLTFRIDKHPYTDGSKRFEVQTYVLYGGYEILKDTMIPMRGSEQESSVATLRAFKQMAMKAHEEAVRQGIIPEDLTWEKL